MHQGHVQCVLRFDERNYLYTQVPETYFGPAAEGNLWFQRVRSWNVAPFTNFWHLIGKPLVTMWRRHNRGFWSLLALKEDQFYHFYTQMVHILRFPLFLFAAGNVNYWLALMALTGVQLTMSLAFNYLKLPASQRLDLLTVVSFPLYKLLDNWMASVAFCRAMLIEIPTDRHHRTIGEQIESQQLPLPAVMKKLSDIAVKHGPKAGASVPAIKGQQLVEVHYQHNQEDLILFWLLCKLGQAQEGGCRQQELSFLLHHCHWVLPQPVADEVVKKSLSDPNAVFSLRFRLFEPLQEKDWDETVAQMKQLTQ
jgi:hypothetical protein